MARKKTKSKGKVKIKQKKKKFKVKRLKQKKFKKVIQKPKPDNFTFSIGTPFKTKIRVVGIGGGGSSIIAEIRKSLKKVSFVVADTDWRNLKKNFRIQRFHFGQNLTYGLGTGMNPELAKTAAEKEKEKITKIFKGQDISILIASLGGGVGSGATPVFAEVAKNSKNITLGIFTLPFKFEGAKKANIAKKVLESLKDSLNASIVIPNERIFKVIDEKTPISEALSIVNKNLIQSLTSLIEIIYNPGLINIDFADIRTILKGKGKLVFLNTAQAGGKNAPEVIIKNIFHNPLYNCNLRPEKILFNISGGNNLSMVEVEKISKSIAEFGPRAKIIFGISKSSKYKNKIKATLLITGTSSITPKPVRRIKKKEAVKPIKKEIKKEKTQKVQKTKKIKIKKMVEKIKPIEKPLEEPKKVEKKVKIRRNALEIKKAEEKEEDEKLIQEREWEIPAFLRKIKG